MNGIIYCRVSSKEQIEGTSLESQEVACREYARNKHIGVLKVFVEQGESAKFADRTQLLELIEYCRKNKEKAEVLLVWKVDRFARNVSDHYKIKAELLRHGVRIVSVTEPIDSNAEGRLMETILAGFAQFDNDIRAMRTVQGMRRKIQEGIHPWKPPLGYKSVTTKGEKKTKPDLPDVPVFKKLQKAWLDFATGVYTKAEMRRLLFTWGVGREKGRPMPAQSIDKMFRNPYYAGILIDPWSKEEYPGQQIPMVSRDVFAKVQSLVARKSRSLPHIKDRPEFPLRGFVRCDTCSRHLTGSVSRGRTDRYPYYRCGNRDCKSRNKSIPVATIHEEFHTLLDRVAPEPVAIEGLKGTINRALDIRERFLQQREVTMRDSLSRIDRENQELIRMRSQELITDSEFAIQKQSLLKRRIGLEGSRLERGFKASDLKEKLDSITQPLIHLYETWSQLPQIARRRFHQLILPVGFVVGQSGTAELGLLFRRLGDCDGGNSTVVALRGAQWNQIFEEISGFAGILTDFHTSELVSK